MTCRPAALLLLAFTAPAPANDINLPEKLVVGWINSPDVLAQMSYCIPDITQEKVTEIQGKATKSALAYYSANAGRAPYIAAMGDRFACIARNGNGKPILPPSLFKKMLKFSGATEQTTNVLYRNLATQLANRGMAEALVKFTNGNAIELNLFVGDEAPTQIQFSTNFLKADQVDETKYKFVIADDIQSFSTTAHSSAGRRAFSILQEELAPRPLKGDHLLAQGNRETEGYAFEGTTWRFGSGGSIALTQGGNLTMTPQKGEPKSGFWQVDNGVLYFNYGRIFGSAIVEKGNLQVEFRSLGNEAADGERRWTAKLEKSFF